MELDEEEECVLFTLAKELKFVDRPDDAGVRVAKHHRLLKIVGDGTVDPGGDGAVHLHPHRVVEVGFIG